MSRTRISLICVDMSQNAFGRAYVLARVLKRSYEVKVVGAQFGSEVWAPMAGLLEAADIEVHSIPTALFPRFFGSAVKLWQGVVGGFVYAFKTFPPRFWVGF